MAQSDCLVYPYNAQNLVFLPENEDVYDRDVAQLLASMVCLGKILPARNEASQQYILRMIRICEDISEPKDFDFIKKQLARQSKISIILDSGLLQDNPTEWTNPLQTYQQVIIPLYENQNKWSIFCITLPDGNVEGYFVGDCNKEDVRTTSLKVVRALKEILNDTPIRFRKRLHVPSSFKEDPVIIAALLAVCVHHRAKYLLLDRKKILQCKLAALHRFRSFHDEWLGKLDLEKIKVEQSTIPFVHVKIPGADKHLGEEFAQLGWRLIEVDGDGNCGFYALATGLQNIDNHEIRPKVPIPSKNTTMRRNPQWQAKIYSLRRKLQKHSLLLLEKVFRCGEEPADWFPLTGVIVPEDRETLSNFINRSFTQAEYFNTAFATKTEWHMNPYWGSYVFASLFKVRIVLITRSLSYDKTSKEVTASWSTIIYDYNEPIKMEEDADNTRHVQVTQQFGLVRMPDLDFSKKPTIELLFRTGWQGERVDEIQHFQFLRRVLCDEIHPPLENSSCLKEILELDIENQYGITLSDQDVPEPVDLSRNILHEVGPNQNKAQRDSNLTSHHPQNIDDCQIDPNQNSNETSDTQDRNQDEDDHDDHRIDPSQNSNEIEEHETSATQDRNHGEDDHIDNHQIDQNQNSFEIETSPTKKRNQDEDHSQRANDNEQFNEKDEEANLKNQENIHPKRKKQPVKQKEKNVKRRKGGTEAQATITQNDSNEIFRQTRKHQAQKTVDKDVLNRFDEAFFDDLYFKGELKHKTATRMKYDPTNDRYFTQTIDPTTNQFTKAVLQQNVEEFDERLVRAARELPNRWAGNSLGDPGDGDAAPAHLSSKIPTLYQQHNNPFCLVFSLASALFYCGFRERSSVLAHQAEIFCTMHFDEAMSRLKAFMLDLVPPIGRPTLYGRRSIRQLQIVRPISWEEIFEDLTPYPTIVIAVLPDGTISHAFCVVDDLIFDSMTPYALKLQKESVQWIFDEPNVEIYQAIRFNQKYSPPGTHIEEVYSRNMKFHWANLRKAPHYLSTRIRTKFKQHNRHYRLQFSFASTLYYCGFKEAASDLVGKTNCFSSLSLEEALSTVRELMLDLIPEIGRPTIYCKRTKGSGRRIRHITWENLFEERTPYPTIVIPIFPDGNISHAFCVVDDLIFDSTTPYALKLQQESLDWMFNNSTVRINRMIRFNNKYATNAVYERTVRSNWDNLL